MKTKTLENRNTYHKEYDMGWIKRESFEAGYLSGRYEEQVNAFYEKHPTANIIVYSSSIKLSQPSREELMTFLQTFGGTWEKKVNDWNKDKMDYIQKLGDDDFTYCFEAIAVEPPPSCKIVEEDVLIPAQPLRYEKRKVIKCPEPLAEDLANSFVQQNEVLSE